MSLVGAVAVTPTTFVLPSVLWLVLRRPKRNTFEFWINVFIASIMTIMGVRYFIISVSVFV